jgi:hypothetical protein
MLESRTFSKKQIITTEPPAFGWRHGEKEEENKQKNQASLFFTTDSSIMKVNK